MRSRWPSTRGAEVYLGHTRFTAPNAVEVEGWLLRFRKAVIATGSDPVVPPIEGLRTGEYLTNGAAGRARSLGRRPAGPAERPDRDDAVAAEAQWTWLMTKATSWKRSQQSPAALHLPPPGRASRRSGPGRRCGAWRCGCPGAA
jgi:hypothetical protein